MARVLITGMSGTGKSTILLELARRGHHVLDTDYGGWVLPDGTWNEPRMWDFLNSEDSVVVSGTVENQGPLLHSVSSRRAAQRTAASPPPASSDPPQQPLRQDR